MVEYLAGPPVKFCVPVAVHSASSKRASCVHRLDVVDVEGSFINFCICGVEAVLSVVVKVQQ